MGIAIASVISCNLKECDKNTMEQILNVMTKLELKHFDDTLNVETLWAHISRQVLQRGGTNLLFVIPVRVGEAKVIENITKDDFFKAVEYIKGLENETKSNVVKCMELS